MFDLLMPIVPGVSTAPLRLPGSSAEKGSTTRAKALFTVRLCRFDRKPVCRQLITKHIGIQKPYLVDFAPAPIEFTDSAERLDVSHQRSRILIFLGIDQDGPIAA
jgi:hypothetical protein